jgi:DNA modification methylase
LRDYGTGLWDGGDPDCDHTVGGQVQDSKAPGAITTGQRPGVDASRCRKCGARRQDQQLGLEATPDEYVARMVAVFREVRRIIRRDATLWLNLGDAFQNKQLLGMPWRVAFALQADGWYLRADIIWAKPNPLPESVTDRPTQAHEHVFLLSKLPRYFFDQEAVREKAEWARWGDQTVPKHEGTNTKVGWMQPKTKAELQRKASVHRSSISGGRSLEAEPSGSRNFRSVWDISTQPYPDAHFATYPEELVRRCILAGTSERGCCPECGTPWERETETSYEKSPVHGAGSVVGRHYETGANNFDGAEMPRLNKRIETLGWRPSCAHRLTNMPASWGVELRPVPCTVLDPFLGSGTTAHVARKHGRRSIGIELNPDYAELAARRMQQQSLFA